MCRHDAYIDVYMCARFRQFTHKNSTHKSGECCSSAAFVSLCVCETPKKKADRPTSIRERVKPSNSHISFVYNLCIHFLWELFTYTQRSSSMHACWCECVWMCVLLQMHHTNTLNVERSILIEAHTHTYTIGTLKRKKERKNEIKATTTCRPHHYTILPANPFNNCACKMYTSFHRFSAIPALLSFHTKWFLCVYI